MAEPVLAVKVGSALLFVLLGILAFSRRPRHVVTVGFGVFLVGYGLHLAVYNLAIDPVTAVVDPAGADAAWLAYNAFVIAAIGGLAVFLGIQVRALSRTGRSRLLVLAGVLLVSLVLEAINIIRLYADVVEIVGHFGTVERAPFLYAYLESALSGLNLLLIAVCAQAYREDLAPGPRAYVLLALAVGLGQAFAEGKVVPLWAQTVQQSQGMTLQVASLHLHYAFVAACVLWWVVATFRPRSAPARNVLLLLLGVMAAGAAYNARYPLDPVGAPGIVRAVGAVVLVVALLREELLPGDLPRVVVRPAYLGSLVLATLFMVVESSEKFLSDRFGLLFAAVTTGMIFLLFQPIQRWAERTVHGHRNIENEHLYRAKADLAWHDGRLGTDERQMLQDLRRKLGLPLAATQRIDDEAALGKATKPQKKGA